MKQTTLLKAGTRPSSLALTQTRAALDRIEGLLDGIAFEMVPISSVGDTDRTTDLRESPADFFTRELDEALLRGEIDLAVHSAKDLPDPMPSNIDAFWLPWREEPRDVLILSKGRPVSDLPGHPVIGVSSDRREAYCTRRFPNGIQKNIRGNIEERIAQVDDGTYDIVVMAAAALIRLGIKDRITEWIPLDELEVPEGQGYLAITLRKGEPSTLRTLFPMVGKKILLTCSEALQEKAAARVRDFGGQPIPFPLIRLQRRRSFQLDCAAFDWVVVTSPSAVRCLGKSDGDVASTKWMVCGRGTADELLKRGIRTDAQPESNFSAAALIELAKKTLKPGERILRLRSNKAGPQLAEALRETGAEVEDAILYDNEAVAHDTLPDFDAVLFASGSGIESFIAQWGFQALENKTTAVIGQPTFQALEKHNLRPDAVAREATIPCAIESLAKHFVSEAMRKGTFIGDVLPARGLDTNRGK